MTGTDPRELKRQRYMASLLRSDCEHEAFASDEGGPVFCGKCQAPMKPRSRSRSE